MGHDLTNNFFAKILWNFSFPFYISNYYSPFWKKCSFGSTTLVLSRKLPVTNADIFLEWSFDLIWSSIGLVRLSENFSFAL